MAEDKKLLAGKTPRRVKVYLLNGDDWIDNGTGFCVGEIDKESNLPYFLVRNELDSENIILKSFLEGSIQYQRQQDTLIVWTDSHGSDLALSFQETDGCADLCDFIIRVQQGNYSPGISLYYVIPNVNEGDDITELITGPIRYPPDVPTVSNISEVLETINQGANAQFTRTNISEFFVENKYFTKLVEVFKKAEESRDIEVLYATSDVIKSLFLYNESCILEDILSSESKIMGLVGILEYDSEYPNYKASHREFLSTQAFTTVIPVENVEIFKKDFYLNYLKDVVLARFLDEPTFNLIASLIYANQVEIFNYIKSSSILEELFKIYDSQLPEEPQQQQQKQKQRDGVKMLHQYLVKAGLLKMINFALKDEDAKIRILGTELIVIIIEQDVSLVKAIDEATIDNSDPPISTHAIHTDEETTVTSSKDSRLRLSDDMTLISILSKLLVEDKNIGLKNQAYEALKTLLDPNIASNNGSPIMGNSDYKFASEEFEEINTNNYFNAFYTQVAPELFRKLIDLGTAKAASDIRQDELLYQLFCELISFCTREHKTTMSRTFFMENQIILGIAKLLTSNCKMILKLSCIRFLKHLVLLNDQSYTRYLVSQEIWVYFFKFFESVVSENNLANSSCLDFLELIIQNCDTNYNPKPSNFVILAKHIYNNYNDFIRDKLSYVSTGTRFIDMVENNELLPNNASTPINAEEEEDQSVLENGHDKEKIE
ncbi:PSY2 Serine/threonine-protein phosphatase 4 regulatory subunit 3 [Candida maltosa Xu316]